MHAVRQVQTSASISRTQHRSARKRILDGSAYVFLSEQDPSHLRREQRFDRRRIIPQLGQKIRTAAVQMGTKRNTGSSMQ